MTTIQVEVQVSSAELLKAVKQMGAADLDEFVSEVLALKAQRRAPTVPKLEADLLAIINRNLPLAESERYAQLIEKRRDESVSADELAELIRLGDAVERFDAERVAALVQLAEIRHTSLTVLMDELGIRPSTDA